MTAKKQLIKVARGQADFPRVDMVIGGFLDAFLAHPDLLLAVLAETGVLTEERGLDQVRDSNWTSYEPNGKTRYVSPWVPSGDQT